MPLRPGSAKSCREQAQQFVALFDHLVGELLRWQRKIQPEVFGGLEIDEQFEFGW